MEVLVPLIIFSSFIFLIWANISSKKKAEISSKDFDKLLVKIRKEVMSVTGRDIPGKEINQVIGIVRGVSDTQATGKEEFELAEKEALLTCFKRLRLLEQMQ